MSTSDLKTNELSTMGWTVYILGTAAAVAGLVLIFLYLPMIGESANIRDFELLDQDGRTFHRSDLDGKVWVANMIFTRCQGPCPAMTFHMNDLRDKLPENVRFVSFTVDPEFDSPEVIHKYRDVHSQGKPAGWTFLTGEKKALYDLIKEDFQESVVPNADTTKGMFITHSAAFHLIDQRGRKRGRFGILDTRTMEPIPDAVDDLILATKNVAGILGRLPAVHATLNGMSAILLLLGFFFIKKKYIRAHVFCMLTALLFTVTFLVSYLYYHFHAGSTPFQGEGAIRIVYFVILISHTVLASIVVPLAATTLYRAYKRSWAKHRAMARWALPIWLYVSVTGVLVFEMLYVWFPGAVG